MKNISGKIGFNKKDITIGSSWVGEIVHGSPIKDLTTI